MNPPMLVPPMPRRPLILYMTVLDKPMGCVLGQHDESGKKKKERVIYYLSKKFTACKMNYSLLERTWCALAWAAHRLRQYMLSYTTWLVSKKGSNQVHLRKAHSYWENSSVASFVVGVRYCSCHSEGSKRERLGRLSSSTTHK